MKVRSLLVALLSLYLLGGAVQASTGEKPHVPLSSLRLLWHEAGESMNKRDLIRVRETYRRIIDSSAGAFAAPQQWYAATACFGLARTSSRLGDTLMTREGVLLALDRGFWNFEIFMRDPYICAIAGKAWLETQLEHYRAFREHEEDAWPPQPPLVIGPEGDSELGGKTMTDIIRARPVPAHSMQGATKPIVGDASWDSICQYRWRELQNRYASGTNAPLIFVLHGGNASYEHFSLRYVAIANETGANIVVVPGPTRFSRLFNGWEGQSDEMDAYLMSFVDAVTRGDREIPVYLCGFSQGARISLISGLAHANEIRGVLSIAGFMESPIDQELLEYGKEEKLRIYCLSGDGDSPQFVQSLRDLQSQARHVGLPFKLKMEPAMVHEVPPTLVDYFKPAWEWLRGGETNY